MSDADHEAEREVIARANKALESGQKAEIESSDARVVRLTDPPGWAVEAWVYVMDEDGA